ncbi:MAG: proline--tRNA ligase [Candidatus Omnitrophica bacterium]|nr:proline--tRNA ligase [Candidatus Omnitrophota bacterium]
MRWSQTHIPTLRETPTEAEVVSHRLMLRAGLIRKLSSGTYSYLPLGMRSLLKVIGIIREEMNRAGGLEVLLPALQPAEIWKRSGRYALMGPEMIRFKDRHGKEMVLGPTHEEVITLLVSGEVRSYRDLPKNLYQIQVKFRDEPRPRFGVIRSSEFLMKDAYSFDRDEAGLAVSYQKMYGVYGRIFARCGLSAIPVEAETGVMGGKDSHEYMVPAATGEDVVIRCSGCGYAASKDKFLSNSTQTTGQSPSPEPKSSDPCPKCGKPIEVLSAIEVGHIFKLGTKYSSILEATFLDEGGKQKPFIMGCYGIGVTRILAAVVETHSDDSGIRWPVSIAPYPVVIVPINLAEPSTREAVESLYRELTQAGLEVLLDDREVSGGVKLKDADLIGFPIRILISEKTLQKSSIELKLRSETEPTLIERAQALPAVKKLLDKESLLVG